MTHLAVECAPSSSGLHPACRVRPLDDVLSASPWPRPRRAILSPSSTPCRRRLRLSEHAWLGGRLAHATASPRGTVLLLRGPLQLRAARARPWPTTSRLLGDENLLLRAADALFWDRVAPVQPAGEAELDLAVSRPCLVAAPTASPPTPPGPIEQDADIVMFIYREEEHKPTDETAASRRSSSASSATARPARASSPSSRNSRASRTSSGEEAVRDIP